MTVVADLCLYHNLYIFRTTIYLTVTVRYLSQMSTDVNAALCRHEMLSISYTQMAFLKLLDTVAIGP